MSAIVAEKGDGMTESIPAATERLYLTLDGNFTYRAQGKLIFVRGRGRRGGNKRSTSFSTGVRFIRRAEVSPVMSERLSAQELE